MQEHVQTLDVDPLNPPGVALVDTAEDAGRVRNDRIRVGGPQIHGGQAFEDLMGQPHGRPDAQLQRGLVRDAGAVRVARFGPGAFGRLLHLMARTVDKHDPDAQRAQHGEIEQNVGKVGRSGNLPVDRHHEDLFAEPRDVLQDFP